ncbi:chaperone DnaJ domain protein [Catenulispora acidiphila DSM 44928]|uniref:Chaperone DnaJ domain protein n=1 Tax=Catenulispora acidiphila (strain DSM 44928 / JCM 14897 / NBRC 102108 / NRRL B-24433 / ID139908) TaxID=479433 RepID=C7PWK1_CATAD|nr:J domain-containing protein [Catenulispora acidiphila]ACU75281.1 chaperone DnaJ domain protein [Catenulispora acidiphila DSM 44928]
MARDYYEVLGVPKTADAEQIQQAFRKLARRHHPDVNKDPAAEERFKEINEAYQVLSDPKTRARYDRFGPDFRQIPEDYDEQVAAGRAARAGGFRGGGPEGGEYVDFGGAGVRFEDLFGDIFGGQGGPAGRGGQGGRGSRGGRGGVRMAGADQTAELELSVEEAYRGGKRKITIGGAGGRDYDVTIPAGVVDGQRIRLAGQGGRGYGDAPAGDLYLQIRIAPHPRFRLSGRDITVDLPVSPWEAALGATVPVPTPGGTAKVVVPAGSSTGRKLRLRGEGMPNPKGPPGDLYAEVRIMVPATPTDRERELFEQLAAASSFDPRRRS